MKPPVIPLDKLLDLINLEVALILTILATSSWLFFRFLLQNLNADRQTNLRALFRNLAGHTIMLWVLYAIFWSVTEALQETLTGPQARGLAYFGLVVLLQGSVVFVKTSKIIVFEYLFVGNKNRGVPLLLIDIFTLMLSLVVAAWLATTLFGLKLAPLLATSAVFSIVLGLALQDTLGNLFAGIALQVDKPYEIGDWVEILNGSQKLAGQVYEISWRATVLVAITDETLTIPNRIMAQAQVLNFSSRIRPFLRSQYFRIQFDQDLDKAKDVLTKVAEGTDGVLDSPHPVALINETTDSWIGLKLVYAVDNYGSQYTVADRILTSGVKALKEAGFALATQRVRVDGEYPSVE
jgi:small-conductance mechanosensitive channel